jgi:hypothetical protein
MTTGNDFLDSIAKGNRPGANVSGDFDCFECRERIGEAYMDRINGKMMWWCSQDHLSSIEVSI